jgi:hypothetical protein
MDYAIGGLLVAAPAMMGMNSRAVNAYRMIGSSILGMNSMTDVKGAAKRMIPLRTHKMADAGVLAATMALTFTDFIRKDKKALSFHVGFMALSLTEFLLTDFKNQSL